ncbi:spherulation-specific family 4 protein [Aquabacterium humicola]|uniref:spherulation-specific family 4 protein n=1 Tax=Aquabacterium humicola TaxID=3237377 RepID=UPI00254290E3|nr:spherulation-specific family 4 protein [Rubrivivax pictus]
MAPSLFKSVAAAVLSLAACSAHAVGLLVPAYFYPSFDPAQSQWDEMTAALAQGASITAIMNVNNGPGGAPNSDYLAAVQSFRAAGGRVLGYVYTCYGNHQCAAGLPATRSVDDVLADVQRYAQWYPVDGIFLDEMSNQTAALPFYQQVSHAVRGAHPDWQLFGNPGTAAPADYLAFIDTIVTVERGTGSYDGIATEPWMHTAPASRQAHLHYNVSDTSSMLMLLAEAVQRHAGYVYITNDRYTPGNPAEPNPWDTLPGYWSEEVAAVAAVPEPHAGALLAAALAALGIVRLRKVMQRSAARSALGTYRQRCAARRHA